MNINLHNKDMRNSYERVAIFLNDYYSGRVHPYDKQKPLHVIEQYGWQSAVQNTPYSKQLLFYADTHLIARGLDNPKAGGKDRDGIR